MIDSCLKCKHYIEGKCKPYEDFVGWIKINDPNAESNCKWFEDISATEDINN